MDRVMALLAFLVLAGFLAILMVFVPHADLIAVSIITLLLVLADFFLPRLQRRNGGRGE